MMDGDEKTTKGTMLGERNERVGHSISVGAPVVF